MKIEVVETSDGKRFRYVHQRTATESVTLAGTHLSAELSALSILFDVVDGEHKPVGAGQIIQSHHDLIVFAGSIPTTDNGERIAAAECEVGWVFEFSAIPPHGCVPCRDFDRNLATVLFGLFPYIDATLLLYELKAES